jgi:hypothetical protein
VRMIRAGDQKHPSYAAPGKLRAKNNRLRESGALEADESFPLQPSSPYSAVQGSDLLALGYHQTAGNPAGDRYLNRCSGGGFKCSALISRWLSGVLQAVACGYL